MSASNEPGLMMMELTPVGNFLQVVLPVPEYEPLASPKGQPLTGGKGVSLLEEKWGNAILRGNLTIPCGEIPCFGACGCGEDENAGVDSKSG